MRQIARPDIASGGEYSAHERKTPGVAEANVLLALAVAVGAGTQSFHKASLQHARELLARASPGEAPIVRAEDIATLPPPVQRWLQASGAVGRPRARTVRLVQRGGMRTAPDQPYLPAEAKQYFIVDEPGFVWTVDVTMMRAVPVVGRDTYVDGLGRMLIKAGGLVAVADGTGPTFDQGTALRFLGEVIWFPSGALTPYITWAPIDDRRAQATLTNGKSSTLKRIGPVCGVKTNPDPPGPGSHYRWRPNTAAATADIGAAPPGSPRASPDIESAGA